MSGGGAVDEALSFSEQDQKQLDKDKRKIRLDNETYLRKHPEIATITAVIISEVLKESPADPVSFVAEYMTKPDLKAKVLQTGSTDGIV